MHTFGASTQSGRDVSVVAPSPALISSVRVSRKAFPSAMSVAAAGRLCFSLLAVSALALVAPALQAQARPTATRAGDLQVGGGFSLGKADYDTPRIRGGSIYASFDFKEHFGAEIDFHQANTASPDTLYERSYEVGGRYVRHYGIFNPYARLMYGRGVFNYEFNEANLAYNQADAGIGVDINVARRINVRADYEYQNWFGFKGNLNNPDSSQLNPQLFTIGAAYHFQ